MPAEEPQIEDGDKIPAAVIMADRSWFIEHPLEGSKRLR